MSNAPHIIDDPHEPVIGQPLTVEDHQAREPYQAGEPRGVQVPRGFYQVDIWDAALDLAAGIALHVRVIPSTRGELS